MKKIIYGALAMLVLASCNKNEEITVPGNGNYPSDGVVRISTTVNDLKTRSGATPYTGSTLSVSLDYGVGDKYTQSNIKWTSQDNGTTWEPGRQMLWKNATTEAKVYAFAPFVEGDDLTAVPFTVQYDQSTGIESSDLLGHVNNSFIPGSSLTTKNELNIDLSHKLSKLTINMTFGGQYETAPAIKSVSINSVQPTVSYNATTGVATASGGTTMIKMHALSATSYEVIFPAQTISANTKMLTVVLSNDDAYNYTVPASGHTFVNGAAYTMKLKVGKEKIELDGITVEDWTTGEPITGGEAEVTRVYLDPNFAAALETAASAVFNKLKDDNDGNGKYIDLKDAEVMTAVKEVKRLYLYKKNITSLNGIEYFTGVTNLDCSNNNITTLDLNALTELEELSCEENKLTNLDVSKLTKLTNLNCSKNELTALDVSKLTNLVELGCKNNNITILDVSKLTKLTGLLCYTNNIATLDVSNLTNLERLNCMENDIEILNLGNIKNLKNLDCSYNKLTTLDVGNLTNLTFLRCYTNSIGILDVSNLTNLKEELSCYNNKIGTLDVGNLTNLEDLACFNNNITILDVSKLTKLTSLYCYTNNIATLDVSKLTNLTNLYCNNNNIASLDVGNLTNLAYLLCQDNNIATLDVGNLTNLTNLYCSNNAISALDISLLAKLRILYCGKQKENHTLNLALTQEQYNTKWSTSWGTHPNNENVTANSQ